MTDARSPISREQVLGGPPLRRASTVLFAIESRAAQLVRRSRRALLVDVTAPPPEQQERAFLAALAAARTDAPAARVEDLDRHAAGWRDLVPDDPSLAAALAHLVLRKYRVPPSAAGLRAALRLDDPRVTAAYEAAFGEPPVRALAAGLTARERLRWWRSRTAARIDRMPAFWMAFALTLTETVGGGVLALPIALAGLGLETAILLVVVFGLVNMVTVAALSESITRVGRMRYGSAYFGRLVLDLLGRPGLAVFSIALVAIQAVVLTVGLTGFGDVLGGATGIHPAAWMAGLFAITLLILARGSLDATIASAVVVGTLNLAALGAIVVVAMAAPGAPAASAPPAGGAATALVFGVLLCAFFGHISAGNVARVVLARDPGGGSLLRGTSAAMGVVIVLYIVLLVAVTHALGQGTLAGYPGTFITPLAAALGPLVGVLGALYATLALGIGSLYGGLGLSNLAGEALEPLRARSAAAARWLSGARAGFAVRVAPAVAIFVVLEAIALTGGGSFSEPLGLLGTLAAPVIAGIFPMLMIVAARRRGDRLPARVVRLLGSRPLVWSVWLLYVAGVAVHGVVWSGAAGPLAVAVAIVLVLLTALVVRRGALRPAASLEVRTEPGIAQRPVAALVAGDRRADVAVAPRAGALEVDLPALGIPALRIWVHRVEADDTSHGVPLAYRVTAMRGAAGEDVVAEGTLGDDGEARIRVPALPLRVELRGPWTVAPASPASWALPLPASRTAADPGAPAPRPDRTA